MKRTENINIVWRISERKLNFFGHMEVKGPEIYVSLLTGKPEEQRFTIRSGVLTSTSSRRCGAISGRLLPVLTGF